MRPTIASAGNDGNPNSVQAPVRIRSIIDGLAGNLVEWCDFLAAVGYVARLLDSMVAFIETSYENVMKSGLRLPVPRDEAEWPRRWTR
jgi:hypothetical protein